MIKNQSIMFFLAILRVKLSNYAYKYALINP